MQLPAVGTHLDPGRPRDVFCNRTLNLRSIKAVGCDMDYTLIHYNVEHWERRAYEHTRKLLVEQQRLPVADLEFDPALFSRGLIIDLELGNIIKANRFGYVTRAAHGTELLSYEAQREAYARVWVDLSEPRWVFMNTLFSLSEACLYAQLVELLDRGALQGMLDYEKLYDKVRAAMNAAHIEGALKAEIVAAPERFVDLDPELPLALLDLKGAGKRLLLITNSEWPYTRDIMAYAFDRFLPGTMTWRELFDIAIVSAAKPGFFEGSAPIYEVVDDSGLLRPFLGTMQPGGAYLGGHARLVEAHLGLSGEEILYVGDHIYADVHVSKQVLRWRTALVLRELEHEVAEQRAFADKQQALDRLMADKERLERQHAQLRLGLQRAQGGYAEPLSGTAEEAPARLRELRAQIAALDDRIAPLAREAGELVSRKWGPLLRAGSDKSRLARQVERYADIYMSRVSNLLYITPYAYLRAPRGSLPHD